MLLHQARPAFALGSASILGVDDDLRAAVVAGWPRPADMFLLGLTGSIAMGKSTASRRRSFGVPVFDADAEVHRLFAPGGALAPVAAAFPGCIDPAGGIDRAALGRQVFADAAALEARGDRASAGACAERRFLERCAAARRPLAVLDIPLLYETGGERLVDAVAVVSAPAFLQAQRVLRRKGMSADRLAAIRRR